MFYHGPGRWFVRGYLGDVFVVAFLYFLLSIFLKAPRRLRACMILLLALGVEGYQMLQHAPQSQSLAKELTVGSTADPWDLLSYVVGLGIALLLERRVLR